MPNGNGPVDLIDLREFVMCYVYFVLCTQMSQFTVAEPRAGSGVVRIDPLHFLAGCC